MPGEGGAKQPQQMFEAHYCWNAVQFHYYHTPLLTARPSGRRGKQLLGPGKPGAHFRGWNKHQRGIRPLYKSKSPV